MEGPRVLPLSPHHYHQSPGGYQPPLDSQPHGECGVCGVCGAWV